MVIGKSSHLTRGAWIETICDSLIGGFLQSHLTRGAWIETRQVTSTCMDQMVAPHTRCVD
ncbi:hypothetical protein HMPREF3038_03194 [Akkermansia sp. KLE1797]|nr:hypothetical protein HMPREF3038_03194 [Akkermansia sp. KLE1797]